ncbi:MAG: sugar isomerase [Acidobacteria bacterium]|nr:MAG: sugar isomerase [Acidobacteriota bacterium]PYU59952.1 MAG: sugar isomerase [Acidobacteriota bacterium]PYU72683.1 MAG: sugar isomerase [Acidobacteriota bacterium]
MKTKQTEAVWKALDNLRIELPSWGFANTGTRFGKFIQLAAASTIEEKFSDAAQVHAVTGACPTMALHVQWDLPNGSQDAGKVKELAKKHGVKPGSINPNVFQDQEYKYGSLGNPDESIRRKALTHILDCVRIAETLNCRDISPWFADGSNYPGTQSIRKRIGYFEEGLKEVHGALRPRQRLLVEYKPFEPAFYHTDIADWGMALLLARAAGPQAYVLVDTGHHYQAQNIEQIVAWLLHQKMIGGFHFNDRRYADDDLTLGSIDPYQVFRIFHEILAFEAENGATTDIAFMVDQSHNLKGKIEAMIQTVCSAQELYAKAATVDHERLAGLQQSCALVDAEECLRGAFWLDVRPIVAEWRKSKGLPEDPMKAFRDSGYLKRVTRERQDRHTGTTASYA